MTQDQELHVPGLVLSLSFEAANTNENWVIHLTSHKKFIVLFSPFHFDQQLTVTQGSKLKKSSGRLLATN